MGGEVYRGKIPLLTDLLVLAEESGLHLNLELKTELTDSDHAIAQLCEATAAVLEMQNFPQSGFCFPALIPAHCAICTNGCRTSGADSSGKNSAAASGTASGD